MTKSVSNQHDTQSSITPELSKAPESAIAAKSSKTTEAAATTSSGNTANSLRAALKDCMIRDRFRLSKRIHGANKIKNPQAKAAVFDEIAMDIARSMMTVQNRSLHKPHIEYPENLPVSQKRDDIAEAISNNQVVIIAGETGSGKTTQIPKICSELGRGRLWFNWSYATASSCCALSC